MTDATPSSNPPRPLDALTLASGYFGLLTAIYLSVFGVAIVRGLFHPINDFQRFVSWMVSIALPLLAAGSAGAAYGLHKRRIWGGVLGLIFVALTLIPALFRGNLIGLALAFISGTIGVLIGTRWHELGTKESMAHTDETR